MCMVYAYVYILVCEYGVWAYVCVWCMCLVYGRAYVYGVWAPVRACLGVLYLHTHQSNSRRPTYIYTYIYTIHFSDLSVTKM